MFEPYGYCIFSDDVRHEVNGKVTLVGTYSDTLIVHTPFPVNLKICISMVIVVPNGNADDINGSEIRIYFPGDEADSPSVTSKLESIKTADAGHNIAAQKEYDVFNGPPVAKFMSQFIANVHIPSDGFVRIRAILPTGKIVYMGALHVKFKPPSTPATASPPPSEQSPPAAQPS